MGNRVHASGEAHLRSLIEAGHYNASASWSFSADDGNRLLGKGSDWGRYSNVHLGEDPSVDNKKSKGRWRYPAAKANGGSETVFRSGLVAAKQRAAAEGDTAIENAADSLIELIDTKSGKDKEPDNDVDDKKAEALYPHVAAYVTSTPWAVMPEVLSVMQEVLELRTAGQHFTPAQIRARIEAASPTGRGIGQVRSGSIAVVPVHGVIAHRASLMSTSTGGTSVEAVRSKLRAALADSSVSAIVLDVDSPGGNVEGIPELAAEIFDGRQQKPIVAVANAKMGSAAYWLASQASEVVGTPSSMTGSIGVYGMHEDRSKMMEKRGVATTVVSAGKFKTEGHPFAPLSDDARAAMQSTVDDAYSMFTRDVARGRGVSAETVQNGMGQGRTLPASRALKAGLIDRIGTLDETVARLKAKAAEDSSRMYAPAPSAPARAEGVSRARLRAAFR